ncbi:GTPase [Acinetobacter nectaris]|uniref:GTPase n=1 Tax=Acinetobacter nectaris TaxID=1219382 RepID=UPI001F45A4A9|nr:GTPase [Acinetobacter nectaris]MCF9035311.1 GTPase [Acinetobacter nectaris]
MDTQNLSPDFFAIQNKLTRKNLSFCNTDLLSIQQWSEQLNASKLGDSSKALLNAAIEISELRCTEELRYELLQGIHLNLNQTINFLEQKFITDYAVNSDHQDNITELVQILRGYLVKIYTHISFSISETLDTTKLSIFSVLKRKHLQKIRFISIYLAMEQLSLLKYQQVLIYRGTRIGQWRCVHQLFSLAKKNNLENKKIISKQVLISSISKNLTILDLYKQVNLINVLNTHQIRPIEIYNLYQCSFEWLNLVKISEKENTLSRYIINLDKDFPPISNNFQNNEEVSDHKIFIETQALYEHINLINFAHHKSNSKIERDNLTPALTFHILNILSGPPNRRFERYNFTSNIRITLGLKDIHYYLSNAISFHKLMIQKKTPDSFANKKNFSEKITIDSNWDSMKVVDNQHNSSPLDSSDNRQFLLNSLTKHEAYNCTIIDISVNGYRMKWNRNMTIPSQLQTGELTLLQENKQSPWRIGVIRWLQQNNNHIEFGIEIISQEITACAIQLSNNKNQYLYPAIIIKNDILNEISTSIIVPGYQQFREHQSISLHLGKDIIKIFLKNIEIITQSFTLLDFDLLNDHDEVTLNTFIQQNVESRKNLDLWGNLK